MTFQDRSSGFSRAISLSGILALSSGLGLILALRKFDRFSHSMGPMFRFTLFAIAVILLVSGLKQTIQALWPGGRKRRIRRINRNRVLLPTEGLMYLLIMIVLFVGALLGRSNMLMLIFAMMAGPFVINGWITFSLLKLTRVQRLVHQRAMAGEILSVEVEIENRKRWLSCWLMAAKDTISSQYEQLEATVLFARVPPRDRRSGYYRMRLQQRGKYFLGPIELTTRFPLGLVQRGLVFDLTDEILVHPRIGHLSSTWQRDHLMAVELVQRRSTRKGAYDDDFHRLREYRWGDDPRSIHWRTSARRSELMVREFHQSRDQHLNLILDLWAPRTVSSRDQERVELAVSFAATVCLTHLRQGHDSTMSLAATGKKRVEWQALSGGIGAETMLDTLALVEAGPALDVRHICESTDGIRASGSMTILITTRRADQPEMLKELDEQIYDAVGERAQSIQIIPVQAESLAQIFTLDLNTAVSTREASRSVVER